MRCPNCHNETPVYFACPACLPLYGKGWCCGPCLQIFKKLEASTNLTIDDRPKAEDSPTVH
jgi:hypothetical protein